MGGILKGCGSPEIGTEREGRERGRRRRTRERERRRGDGGDKAVRTWGVEGWRGMKMDMLIRVW